MRNPPVYTQLVAGIREAIAQRQLLPGDQIPSIADLVAEHRCGRATATKVHRVLEDGGWAITRPGTGIFVSDQQTLYRNGTKRYRRPPCSKSMPHQQEVANQGPVPRVDFLERNIVLPPTAIAYRLRAEVDEEVVARYHHLVVDGKVVALADSFYRQSFAAGTILDLDEKVEQGTHAYIADEMGYRLERFHEELRFRRAMRLERDVLGTEYVADLLRTLWNTEGEVLQVSNQVFNPDRYVFEYDTPAH